MRWKYPLALASMLFLLLAACEKNDLHRYQSFAFGTLIEIKVRSDDKTQADSASAGLFANFDVIHKNLHAWEPGKLTETSTKLATGEWFTADADVLDILQLAKRYSLQSEGLFTPTIGQLIQAWGFQGNELPQSPPGQEDIDKFLADLPTVKELEIDVPRMRGHNAHIKLDLGAIAKGFAVSQGIQKLRKLGIKHALVNAGGDLCGIGDQGKRPWRIGIRNPSGEGILASLELKDDECVFTSGDYERYFTYNNKRYHHIIDPRSGYPADKLSSVTVLHQDGAKADAASTALFIAGPDGWQKIAKMMGIQDVMMVDKKGLIIMSPSMQKRIKLEAEHKDRELIISKPLTSDLKPET